MVDDIINKLFNDSVDDAEHTSFIILTLQNYIINKDFITVNSILTHHKVNELSPSIILGMLFITENIEELKASWNMLNEIFISFF